MLISEMEAVLKSLDQRVGRIEQILPTLATKTDLERYATRTDLFAATAQLRDQLREEIRDEIRGVKVLIEDSRSENRLLAEHMVTLLNQMTDVVQRLDRIERR